MRILLIEDDAALCRVLQPALQAAGFGCDCCPNGADGLALLRTGCYDVLDTAQQTLAGPEGTVAVSRRECDLLAALCRWMVGRDAAGDRHPRRRRDLRGVLGARRGRTRRKNCGIMGRRGASDAP